jgi:hypothetical protein
MNLQDALLCVECEAIYSFSSRCPRCGSRDSAPLGSAFDPALPLAATEVADPVELLRAVRSSRRRRAPEYDTLAVATALLALLAPPLSAAVAQHAARPPATSSSLCSSGPLAEWNRHASCSNFGRAGVVASRGTS